MENHTKPQVRIDGAPAKTNWAPPRLCYVDGITATQTSSVLLYKVEGTSTLLILCNYLCTNNPFIHMYTILKKLTVEYVL